MAVASFLMERPPAPRRPERRRLGSSAVLSALLHLGLLLALVLLAQRRAETPHWLPPPSVQMLFEGGGKGPVSVPNKAPLSPHRPASPPPAPIAPLSPAPSPVAPPAQPAPRRGLISPRPLPPPVPAPSPPAQALPQPAPAIPSLRIAPVPQPAVPTTRPSPVPAPVLPLPPAQPAAPPRPPATASHPLAARPPLRFPAPMAFSLGAARPPAPRPAPAHPPGRGINLSFAPQGAGSNRLSIDGLLERDGVGPDWSNAFSAWLTEHSYYPRDAGELGQEGDVVVDFVVGKDGTVTGLQLVSSSGYPLLDTATLSMFRDARLPPLPPQDGARLPVHFTMRYMIIHP